jgi:hypothetical protein
MDNTSGRKCSTSELPESARKLSWGGFWFSIIWGIFNGVWISLLGLIFPFIINIILLIKGRQWAWENKRWDSEEEFDRVQHLWGMWGLILSVIPIVLIIICLGAAASLGS